MEQLDYRKLLVREFGARVERNPRYSLRSFARDLRTSPSRLSEIFHEKQGLSQKTAGEWGERLGWDPQTISMFKLMVLKKHARSFLQKELAESTTPAKQIVLELDKFEVIADWYHLAVFELLQIPKISQSLDYLATLLGASQTTVREVLERLERLKLLKLQAGGRIKVLKANISIGDTIPSAAVRRFHHQMLKIAQDALDKQNIEERDFAATILQLSENQIPAFKMLIKEFRKNIRENLPKPNGKRHLYGFNTQLVRLTKKHL